MKLSLVFCSTIAAALVACAGSGGSPQVDQSLTGCVPNMTLRCTCGLDDGTQTCTADRTLTACHCPKTGKGSSTSSSNSAPLPTTTSTTTPPPPASNCGNATVDPGEACDDGNTTDGDGCSAQCQPDGAPAGADKCPGQAVTLWKGAKVVLAGTTEGFSDDTSTSCVPSNAPDRIYAVQPSADGFMSVDAVFAAGYDALVEVRRDDCSSSHTPLLCEDTFSTAFQRVVEVKTGHTYYIVLDGDSTTAAGAYTIHLELP